MYQDSHVIFPPKGSSVEVLLNVIISFAHIESGFGNKQLYIVSKLAIGLGHMVIIAVSVS